MSRKNLMKGLSEHNEPSKESSASETLRGRRPLTPSGSKRESQGGGGQSIRCMGTSRGSPVWPLPNQSLQGGSGGINTLTLNVFAAFRFSDTPLSGPEVSGAFSEQPNFCLAAANIFNDQCGGERRLLDRTELTLLSPPKLIYCLHATVYSLVPNATPIQTLKQRSGKFHYL